MLSISRHATLTVITDRIKRESVSRVPLPSLLEAIQTPEDRILVTHYMERLSNVLTVETEAGNPFKEILLNLATQHPGLLHSVLAVSGAHIDLNTEYGALLLQQQPAITAESLRVRSNYHSEEAMRLLREDMNVSSNLEKEDTQCQLILAARYGQMLCLVLRNLIEGSTEGKHRIHLRAYQRLIQDSPPKNPALHTFITEFFQYHIYADDLIFAPDNEAARLSKTNGKHVVSDSRPPQMMGVYDGLFQHLRDITSLRNKIRNNLVKAPGLPALSYVEIFEADTLNEALRSWSPDFRAGDNRAQAGELYRLALWAYLIRTIRPPASTASDLLLGSAPVNGLSSERRSSTTSSTGHHSNIHPEDSYSREYCQFKPMYPSRANSMSEDDGLPTPAPTNGTSCPPSPPPSRRPSQDDKQVAMLIVKAMSILESFSSSDPCQTLLLIPCLLLGTSCFDATQRPRFRAAVQGVKNYTGLRNADRVQELLDETWSLMDQGDWAAVWDWQGIAKRKQLDFLCT